MNFSTYVDEFGDIVNPYAGKTSDGQWIEGTTDSEFLNNHFGKHETLDECTEATESEGLKLFLEHLKATQ